MDLLCFPITDLKVVVERPGYMIDSVISRGNFDWVNLSHHLTELNPLHTLYPLILVASWCFSV
jgi:hypothetical protein